MAPNGRPRRTLKDVEAIKAKPKRINKSFRVIKSPPQGGTSQREMFYFMQSVDIKDLKKKFKPVKIAWYLMEKKKNV